MLNKFTRALAISVALLSLAASLFFPSLISTVSAQPTGNWENAGTITYNGQTYIDREVGDSMDYFIGGEDDCTSVIRGFNNDYWSANYSSAELIIKVKDPLTGACSESDAQDITLTNTHNARLWYRWVDSGLIESVVGEPTTFSAIPGQPGVYAHDIDNDCRSSITITNPDDPSSANMDVRIPFSGCQVQDTRQIRIGETQNADLDAGTGTATNAPSFNSEDGNTCEGKSGSLGWILCPGIDLLDGAINWVDNQIQRLLEVDRDKYTNDDLKRAWGTIRNISYTILIPIMLVMVIGTAIGVEAFSAYTVKKALPRMVIAIIFITLSWYICTFLIGFFNTVGSGTLGLITAPFREQMQQSLACQENTLNLTCLFSNDMTVENPASILRGIVTYAANLGLVLGLVIFLLVYAIPLLFGAAAAFLILLLRQMFIIGLVLIAPLAILAWIFPGNDKLWKFWWNAFTKLLIMFPLIMGIIALGRVFAWLINVSDGGALDGAIIQPIMKLGAYLLPYAVIPFTFKFAGGIFANLAGMINDRDKGLIDRATGLRNKGLKKLHENTMDGTGRLGKPESRVGNTYRRAANFGRHGSFSPFRKGRSRWEEYEMMHREKAADKLLEEGGGRAFNDDDASNLLRQTGMTRREFIRQYSETLRLQGRGSNDAERAEMAERALARSEQAVGAKVGSATMVVAAQKFRTAMTNTAYEAGTEGLEALQRDLMDLQRQGLITAVDGAGWMKSNRGRPDYSANGFNDTIRFASGQIGAGDQLAGAFHGADPREVLGGHQRAVESFAQQAQMNLSDALASGNQVIIDKALADVANIYDMLSNVSPRKAEEWANGVYAMSSSVERTFDVNVATGETRPASVGPIDPSGTIRRETRTLTVRELMDEARSHADFLDRRKEYMNARDAATAAAANEAMAPPENEG